MGMIESLEGRRLLASTSLTPRLSMDGDTLVVRGGDAAEVFTFEAKFVTVAGNNPHGHFRIDLTAQIREPSGKLLKTLTVPAESVGRVKATLGGGADHFNVETVIVTAATYDVDGGAGNDTISGGGRADVLVGGRGRDALFGEGGDDVVRGGRDNDVLGGGEGDDSVYGEAGDDVLSDFRNRHRAHDVGENSAWRYAKDSGVDRLDGGSGNDALSTYGRVDHLAGIENGRDLASNRGALSIDRLRVAGKVWDLATEGDSPVA